ncbi:hypothetical protein RBB50_000358 [Rhinocladiella similis]
MGCFLSKNAVSETVQAPRPRTVTYQLSTPSNRSSVKAPRSPPESLGKRAPGPPRSRLVPPQLKQFQDARMNAPHPPDALSDDHAYGTAPNDIQAVYLPRKWDREGPAKVNTFADFIEDPKAYRVVWCRRLEE